MITNEKFSFNFDNFFPHLINHPDEAKEGDEWKAWFASIVLGIFTVGIVHAGCALYEFCFKKVDVKKLDDSNEIKKADQVKENIFSKINHHKDNVDEVEQAKEQAHEPVVVHERDLFSKTVGETNKISLPLVFVPSHNSNQFPKTSHQKISIDDLDHWRSLSEEERIELDLPEFVDRYPAHLYNSKTEYGPFDTVEAYVNFFWEEEKVKESKDKKESKEIKRERIHSLRTGFFDIDDIAFQNFAIDMLSGKYRIGDSFKHALRLYTKPWECTELLGLDKANPKHTLPITMLIRARNQAISSRPDIHPDGRMFTEAEKANGRMNAFYQEKKASWDSLEIFSWFDVTTGNLMEDVDLESLLEASTEEAVAPLTLSVSSTTTLRAVEVLARKYPKETDRICWLNFANAHMDGGILKGPSKPEDTNHGSQEENTVSECSAAVIQAAVSEIVHDGDYNDGRARYKQGFHIPPGGNFFMQTSFVTGDRVKCNSIACAFADFRSGKSHIDFSEFRQYSQNGQLLLDDKYQKRIFMDIYGVLATAKAKKQKYLVLGGSGCGAFKHDHKLEAEMWKTVLALPEFAGCFKEITFAITSNGTAETFRKVLVG